VAGPREQSIRYPAVAGIFYPSDAGRCRELARSFVRPSDNLPADTGPLWGAIVPHAGWICSGAIAGEAIGTLARCAQADVVVVFGAIHTPIHVDYAALDTHERWSVPGEESDVAVQSGSELNRLSGLFRVDVRLHEREHAVEVELPLIQVAWPAAQVLPIEVPLISDAVEIGKRTAEEVLRTGRRAVFLASSDLTHYGPLYRFAPAGVGIDGLNWALENDRRLLELVIAMSAERIVPEVRARQNACGGGAIAAMLAACRIAGAAKGLVLRHANSFETLAAVAPQPSTDAVGYAAVVVE
jgi:AmmeMemoRadiSam system protein B